MLTFGPDEEALSSLWFSIFAAPGTVLANDDIGWDGQLWYCLHTCPYSATCWRVTQSSTDGNMFVKMVVQGERMYDHIYIQNPYKWEAID